MHLVDIIGDLLVHSCLPDFLGIDVVSMNKDHLSRLILYPWYHLSFNLKLLDTTDFLHEKK